MSDETDPADLRYAYGAMETSDLEIRYAYEVSALQFTSTDFVYRYGHQRDRWDRKHGCWGWTTQEIGNLFPRWHAARLNTFGDTQKLINAWGQNLDLMKMEYARFRRNLFIDEAPLDQPDVFAYGPGVPFGAQSVKPRGRNLLLNPSFALRGLARKNHPMWWSTDLAATTGSVALVESPSFIGSYSARLHTEPGERAYLRQTFAGRVISGESVTASLWYLVPIPEELLENSELRAGIYLTVMYRNGAMDIVRKTLDLGTDGVWRRASVTVTLAEESVFLTMGIQVENDGLEPVRIYAGAAQLEVSPVPTPWGESDRTFEPLTERLAVGSPFDAYIDEGTEQKTEEIVTGQPVTYAARKGRSLRFVKDQYDMWRDAIPDRATATVSTDPPSAVQRDTLGWYSNPEGERYTTRWRIKDDRLEQYNSEIDSEVCGTFDIGEFGLEEDGTPNVGVFSTDEDPGFSRTLETLCVVKNRLFVVCLETEGGVTKRVCKILDPRSRWPLPLSEDQKITMHLECIGDFEIEVSTGTASYVGVVEENADKLLLKIDDDFYVVELEFPYYQFNFDKNQAILRTAYAGGLVTV